MISELPTIKDLSTVIRWKLRRERTLHESHFYNSLAWLKRNPQELAVRLTDFDRVNNGLSTLVSSQEELGRSHKAVERLRELLNGAASLPDLQAMQHKVGYEMVEVVIQGLLDQVRQSQPTAVFHTKFPSLGSPATHALVRGYGSLLGVLNGDHDSQIAPEIEGIYPSAFAAVLFNSKEMRTSPLVTDLVGWMYDGFSALPGNLRLDVIDVAQKFNPEQNEA